MSSRQASRVITVFAIGFLALDGGLLLLAGYWSSRGALVVWGVVFLLAAVSVFWAWRRHVRRLDELRTELLARGQELLDLHREIDGGDGS